MGCRRLGRARGHNCAALTRNAATGGQNACRCGILRDVPRHPESLGSAQRTWSQAELAREVGIQSAQLTRILESLERDVDLQLNREAPPPVYWSLPKGWFPGGVFYQGPDVETLLRLLARSAKSKGRDRLIAIGGECVDCSRDCAAMLTEVVRTPQPTATEVANQEWVERSALEIKGLHGSPSDRGALCRRAWGCGQRGDS